MSEESKNCLLETYELKLDRGWYWQKKENMSPWKVFSEAHYKERSVLWLLFRVHKLCIAKYLYFSKHIGEWSPIRFEPDRIVVMDEYDIHKAEGFLYNETERIITITKLQQITDKQLFVNWIEVITNN